MIEPLRRGSIRRASAWQERKTPSDIHIEDPLEAFARQCLGGAASADAGIVYSYRERPEIRLDALDCSRKIDFGGHIAFEGHRPPPGRANASGRLLQPALRGMTETGDVRARFGKPDRNRLADATARAGDQSHFLGEVEEISF